jgi:hypothetical protein
MIDRELKKNQCDPIVTDRRQPILKARRAGLRMALISDLKNEIERGRTVAKTASLLCPDEDEVRER